MSGSVFVLDNNAVPLMPMAAPYARQLLKQHKAVRVPHHAFSIIKLSRVVEHPVLRPITLVILVDRDSAELTLYAETRRTQQVQVRILVDLRTDIAWRMRRRAGHRRRRRARGRYRAPPRYAVPFKVRRPSLAHSTWARQHRSRTSHQRTYRHIGAVIRWRVQAIMRVITTLRSWVPITHVFVRSGAAVTYLAGRNDYNVRAALTALQGVQKDGVMIPSCAYCGATDRRLGIDHIVPRSRGGTDARANLVLACQACNAAKGARTPEEAGMPLRDGVVAAPFRAQREVPYVTQTLAYLRRTFAQSAYQIVDHHPESVATHLSTTGTHQPSPMFIAKPIGRPTKQRYAARNYPSRLAHTKPLLMVGHVVKRPIRVNRALWISDTPKGPQAHILRHADSASTGQTVRLGMLCQAERAGQRVHGVVVALHSSGRVTLAHPHDVQHARIYWKRVVVSPRQAFRVVSTDRVIFFPWSDNAASHSSTDDEETNRE